MNAQRLFTPLPQRYDLLEELLSFGQNRRWRDQMVMKALGNQPSLVLDVATGTAGVARLIASKSSARVIGLDITESMLLKGKQEVAASDEAQSIDLVLGSAERLPFPNEVFDSLTFTYLLRYVDDPAATLREMGRVVRNGGIMASLEFAEPSRTVWRATWWMYTRIALPLAAMFFGKGWFRVGRFLGPNISKHYRRYSIADHVAKWRTAGFEDVQFKLMSLGGGLVMWGTKSGG
ncbi:MAG: class I SAM-dependent methyltransferase [Actinomycetota bacterium]